MARNTIKGNTALATLLNVSRDTIQKLRKRGVLAPATISDYGRIIIYDVDKVYECLNYPKPRHGRRAAI